MTFDPCLLRTLLREFEASQYKPDPFVTFVKFENLPAPDLDKFTQVYWGLAHKTLRPDTFVVHKDHSRQGHPQGKCGNKRGQHH